MALGVSPFWRGVVRARKGGPQNAGSPCQGLGEDAAARNEGDFAARRRPLRPRAAGGDPVRLSATAGEAGRGAEMRGHEGGFRSGPQRPSHGSLEGTQETLGEEPALGREAAQGCLLGPPAVCSLPLRTRAIPRGGRRWVLEMWGEDGLRTLGLA